MAKPFNQIVSKDDIPFEVGKRAHDGTSFSPERRAEQQQNEYYNWLKEQYEYIVEKAKPDTKERAYNEFIRLRDGYKKRLLDYLHSRSGLMSTMITGPANFPVRSQRKKHNSVDNKLNDLVSYMNYMPGKIKYKLKPDHLKPIKSGQSNAIELLEAKLKGLKDLQETMKACNKIVKSKKLSKDQKIEQLTELGIKDPHSLFITDYAGRTGFPGYSLTNNNANIKRLEGRLKTEKALKEKASQGNTELTFKGGTILNNFDINRVQIFFDDKPEAETRKELKRLGFKWAPSQNAWQRFLTTMGQYHRSAIKELLGEIKGAETEAKQETIEEPKELTQAQIDEIVKIIKDQEEAQEKKFVKDIKVQGQRKEVIKEFINPEQKPAPMATNRLFSEVKNISRDQITTDEKTFQGRQFAFADETVKKIVREGYDKSQEPIIVWFDPEKKKYIVISGHSRWQASQQLYKNGDTFLKDMPVKVFLGDKDDAVDYAVLESNRSGTQEGLKSDLLAYKRAVTRGFNKERLKGLFKPESYLGVLKDISTLNEKGQFIEYLDSPSEQSFPYLKRNAQWVGVIRKMYPALTDSHEKELFDYIYKGKGLKLNKTDFFNLIDRKVQVIDFDPGKPLNLQNIVSSSAHTDPAKVRLSEINEQIKKFERDRTHKEELIVRAKKEGLTDMVKKFKGQVSDINKAILRKIEERTKIESEISQIEQATAFDLFSDSAPTKKPETKKETKPADPPKPDPSNGKFDFIFEVGHYGDYYIKTFLELPVSRSVKFQKDANHTIENLRSYKATEKGLNELKAKFPNNAYGDKHRRTSKDLNNPNAKPAPANNKTKTKHPGFTKSQRQALKRKVELTVKELEKMRDPDHDKLLRIAKQINASRSLYSQFVDNAALNAKRLPITKENVIMWAKNPGRYDLLGVDLPKGDHSATAGLRSLRKAANKAKVFNVFKIVK